jgi:hypothetical protein
MEPNHLSFSPKGTPRTPPGLPAINENNILDGQVRRLASMLKKSGLKTGSKGKSLLTSHLNPLRLLPQRTMKLHVSLQK